MPSKFDEWLTNQPAGSPLHHDYESVNDCMYDFQASIDEDGTSSYDLGVYGLSIYNVDGLECYSCKEYIGYVLDDTDETRLKGSFTPFWQMDEDGQILLCEPCYEKVTLEGDVYEEE